MVAKKNKKWKKQVISAYVECMNLSLFTIQPIHFSFHPTGNDLISTRGLPHGFLLCSKNPLKPLAGTDEINASKDYELPSFYPLSPTIDLIDTNIYKDYDFTGRLRREKSYEHVQKEVLG